MKHFLILLVLGGCSSALAQSISSSVISSAGGFNTTAAGSLSFTVAQPIAGDRSSSLLLHQGFQVNLSSDVGVTTAIEEGEEIKVFPNPAQHHLFIQIPETTKTYRYQLIDASGKSILGERSIDAPSTELDMSTLAPAIYFLILSDSKGKSKALSIIKNN
jgi:hypothetical protein